MIRPCVSSCGKKPRSQDQLHGQGNRVFNEQPAKDGQQAFKCTVCGAIITQSVSSKESK